MKIIGLIGGVTWESTSVYCRVIHEQVRNRRGRLHSASIRLHHFDAEDISHFQRDGDWDAAASAIIDAARNLYAGGARCFALCTTTLHRVADRVGEALPPDATLVHVGEATGQAILDAGVRRIGLLGTQYTMEAGFLIDYLRERYGVEAVVPDARERRRIQSIIADELAWGVLRRDSWLELTDIALALRDRHRTEGIVLASSELALLAADQQHAHPFPVLHFDSTLLHARAVADHALLGLPDAHDLPFGPVLSPILHLPKFT